MSVGPRTASQCAEVVGATPSNCSYHLRELARYGLVERADAGAGRRGAARAAPGGDGRERPWRATASGFDFGRAEDLRPAASTAAQAVAHAGIAESARIAHAAVDGMDRLSAPWREAAGMHSYGLILTAEELSALTAQLDALIRPYIAMTRSEVPREAEHVHLAVTAVPTGERP